MFAKTAFTAARDRLAALPHWVKLLMWAQVMLLCAALSCATMFLAIYQEQFVALWNTAASLLKDAPNATQGTANLHEAAELGARMQPWLWAFVGTVMGSISIGSLVVSLTPWKHNR